MKGIIKYNQKLYRKDKRTRGVKMGDLIKLECNGKSDYFEYNGIYTVANKWRHIEIKNYDGNGRTLRPRLGYDVFYNEFFILKEVQKKINSLPMPAKEEQLCGYTI